MNHAYTAMVKARARAENGHYTVQNWQKREITQQVGVRMRCSLCLPHLFPIPKCRLRRSKSVNRRATHFVYGRAAGKADTLQNYRRISPAGANGQNGLNQATPLFGGLLNRCVLPCEETDTGSCGS